MGVKKFLFILICLKYENVLRITYYEPRIATLPHLTLVNIEIRIQLLNIVVIIDGVVEF